MSREKKLKGYRKIKLDTKFALMVRRTIFFFSILFSITKKGSQVMEINMVPKHLLDSDKAKLFERITILIGQKLSYLVSKEGGWKAKEIYSHVGIPEARQSEYKDFNKYNRKISKRDLILCIGGGIVTIEELIDKCAENDKEKEYLSTLHIYENRELREIVTNMINAGLDPVDILKKAYKEFIEEKE